MKFASIRLSTLSILLLAFHSASAQQPIGLSRDQDGKIVFGTKSKPAPKPRPESITAYNYRWTTFQNGWADVSVSLKNNTKVDVTNVKFRLIFYDTKGEPIHYEDKTAFNIPAGLAVQETISIQEGGTNLYHSTGKIRTQILSFENSDSPAPKPPNN